MVPSKYLMTMMIIVMMVGFYFFARHVSYCHHTVFVQLWMSLSMHDDVSSISTDIL